MSIWTAIKRWWNSPSRHEQYENAIFARVFDPQPELDALVEEKAKPSVVIARWFEVFVQDHVSELAADNIIRLDWPVHWEDDVIALARKYIDEQDDFSLYSPTNTYDYDRLTYNDHRYDDPTLYASILMLRALRHKHVDDNYTASQMVRDVRDQYNAQAMVAARAFIAEYGEQIEAGQAVEFPMPTIGEWMGDHADCYIRNRTRWQLLKMGLFLDHDQKIVAHELPPLSVWEQELRQVKKKRKA